MSSKIVKKYADYIIDAIFGIGFRGNLEGDVLELVSTANEGVATKIALDLPSGCECDTGSVGNACFCADVTISFIGVKPCHVLYPSSDYCGKLVMVGIGIPKENLKRIFDRFYRVDKARSRDTGGTGLGLAIAKQMIQNMGGTIKINSEYQKGTEVIISIPK